MNYAFDLSARLSISTELAKDYKEISIPFGDLEKIVSTEQNYSFFVYKNDYRKESNTQLELTNCIALDFDSGLTIDKAKEIFSEYTFCLATTKSHQKEKNGSIWDRFRLILPLNESLGMSVADYKFLLKKMILELKADNACSDVARFFYGYKDSEVIFNYGKLFDAESGLQKAKKQEEIRRQTRSRIEERKPTIEFTGEKIDTLRAISKSDNMLKVLKFHDKFGAGNRNNYLFSVAMYLRESGFTDDEVISEVLWINSQGDGISENEIEQTIFKSLRIRNV